MFNLVLLGPQGSGKGIQGERLAKTYNLKIIGVGDLSRDEINKNSSIGKKIEKYVQSGELIPINLTKELVNQKIKEYKNYGILFDAFPRNLEQVEVLENLLSKNNLEKPIVIYLKIKKETAIERLSSRLVCPKCETIYNPKTTNYHNDVCKKCHLKLIRREDDKPKAIEKRLNIYYQEIEKIINYYKKENRLIEINGELTINEVFQEIQRKLQDYLRNVND